MPIGCVQHRALAMTDKTRITVVITVLVISAICALTATLILHAMNEKIDRRPLNVEKRSYLNTSWISALGEYRKRYPNGKLSIVMGILGCIVLVGFAFLVSLMLGFGS